MATDVTKSVEDIEMADPEEDKVVTMMDVLQEQEDFEEDANAVLGASDDKNCTYSKGYIKRQALYACMTCCSEAKSDPSKRAGLCLACSLICHENHELVELYTKRNFRCDCGNSKFNSHPCQLTPNKALQNEENSYNQNFSGLYCVCQRPYPDPENKVEDEMIQCTICEDWLHASHLETSVPASDQYTEMICKGCMEKNDFLYCYSNLAVNTDNTDVDILHINENDEKSYICNGDVKTDSTENGIQSIGKQDIDMSENKSETLITEDKIENNQNIENNINESEIISKQDSEDKDNISCKKESPSESAEASTDSPITSDNTEKLNSDIPNLKNDENLQDLNKECNKAEKISEIIMDKNHSDKISEPKTSKDQLKEIVEGDSVSESKENVDMTEVASQDSNTNLEIIGTVKSSNKETEAAASIAEAAISNPNKKDEETKEEDRLLADPESEDNNSKSNLDVKETDDSETLHTVENASSGETAIKENSNSVQDVKNKSLSLTNNDQENSAKLKSELSQDLPAAVLEKATTSGCQEIYNNESNENETNSEKTNSETDGHIEKIINPNTSTEESGNTEHSTSKSSKESESNSIVTEKRKLSTEDEESSCNVVVKKTKLEPLPDIKSCICPKNVKKVHKGATFWPSSFRQKLCTCRECLILYKDLSVLYLIDPDDTVSAYESLGIEKTNGKPSQYEKGLQALSSLDRIQQINALTEYNKMRDKLLDFLKSFKDRKEIVKEEDIKAFFEGMKPTREPDGVYFCR